MRTPPTRATLSTLTLLVAALVAAPAPAQPAADLLEKAIYTEETVGDLDAAIGLYQQIVDDADATRPAAADALYRLGLCHQKQGHADQAAAAFETLVEKYPEQTDLVARAKSQLPGQPVVGPVPWRDGETLRMDMRLPAGMPIGTFAWTADRTTAVDGADAWKIQTLRLVTANGTLAKSHVLAEAESFAPLSSRFEHPLFGDFRASYTAEAVDISGTTPGAEAADPQHVATPGGVYDNEQAVHLIRRLPLEVGYTTELPVFVTFNGGKTISVEVAVAERVAVEVPAGTFDCFRVELLIEKFAKQTLWLSADEHRTLVKLDGDGVVGELSSVSHGVGTERLVFNDDNLGFSLSIRPDWYFYQAEKDKPVETEVTLVEPGLTALFHVDVDTLESAGIDPERPLRELMEAHLDKIRQRRVDFKVRDDSWEPKTIDGLPAMSFVADFSHNGQPMAEYRTVVLGKEVAASFSAKAPADRIDAARPMLDDVVATYRTDPR